MKLNMSEDQERILRTIVRYAGDGRTFRIPEICLMMPEIVPLDVVAATVETLVPPGYIRKVSPAAYRLNLNNAVVVELLRDLSEIGEDTK